MAYNPSPEVRALAELAKLLKANRAILFYTDEDGVHYGYVSWGRDVAKCAEARDIADAVYDAFGEAVAEVQS